MMPSIWSVELWTPDGKLLADLGGLADNRHIILSRNESEEITWRLDLNVFKAYARSIGTPYDRLIQDGITEVRIRRGQKYLCGGQIIWSQTSRSAGQDFFDLRARGFLDFWADRFTGPLVTYTGMDRAAIAWDLINQSQLQGPTWDFGVTLGLLPTIAPYSRQYQNVRIKDALQDLTKLQAAFDFSFSPNKIFNMYPSIGSRRPDVIFQYPGNCTSLNVTNDATNIANQLYLLGSGIGDAGTLTLDAPDASSQLDYKVHEKPIILSDVLDSGTLGDYAQAQLAAWSRPFSIPAVEYDGAVGPSITDFGIGDYVQVLETDDPDTQVHGFYRVEMIDITIDENDKETIKVSFGL